MTSDPPLGHDALLTLARKTQAAAEDGDRDRLEEAARHLLEAVADHVGGERVALGRLAPDERRRLLEGQKRVIDLLVELAVAAHASGPYRCKDLTQQLFAELGTQAEDERLADARNGPSFVNRQREAP